jgi:hypothetical protein
LRAEHLQNIDLVGNNIGAEGVLTIVKANFGKISEFNLSDNIVIKAAIKLETRDAII